MFTVAKIWKQPKWPLTDEQIKKKKKLLHTHMHIYTHIYAHVHNAMEYYSAIKKELLQFAKTLMDFEDIMLSEISHKKTDKVC